MPLIGTLNERYTVQLRNQRLSFKKPEFIGRDQFVSFEVVTLKAAHSHGVTVALSSFVN